MSQEFASRECTLRSARMRSLPGGLDGEEAA
jgi:hypothetical protein